MDPVTVYVRWIARQDAPPCFVELLQSLPYHTVSQRKVSLAFSRVRPFSFGTNSLFYHEFSDVLSQLIVYRTYDSSRKRDFPMQRILRDLLRPLLPYSQDTTLMALLSMGVRQAPYNNYESVAEVFSSTLRKEVNAATDTFSNTPLDYSPIFTLNSFVPMAHHLPYAPQVNRQVYVSLQNTKERLRTLLLLPRVSTKTVGSMAIEASKHHLAQGDLGITEICTIADAEIVYMKKNGLRLEGPVEMRSAWKYNDLKPRVYYAQGPDVYYASRYIQAVCNVLVDSLDCVHRQFRYYLPHAANATHADRHFTYDYSSFTSRLRELPAFVDALAEFFADTDVTVLDTAEGLITINLGMMFAEYNQVCNYRAQFSVEKVLPSGNYPIREHATGMLGVPGNISLSTLLHGIHLCALLASMDLGKCVGDDAIGMLPRGRDATVWAEFMHGVGALGDIAQEKFTYWDQYSGYEDRAWQYLKRPIRLIYTRLFMEQAFILPGLEMVLDIEDDYHVPLRKSFQDRRLTFIKQWSRFLTRLRYYPQLLTPEGRTFLRRYQVTTYHELGLEKLQHFLLPIGLDKKSSILVPAILPEEEFGKDWISYSSHYWKRVDTPVRLPRVMGMTSERQFAFAGDTILSGRTPLLKVLQNLRLVEAKLVTEVIDLDDIDPWELERRIEGKYDFVYEITALEDIPSWYEECRQYLLMSPHEHLVAYPMDWLDDDEDDTL